MSNRYKKMTVLFVDLSRINIEGITLKQDGIYEKTIHGNILTIQKLFKENDLTVEVKL